MWLLVLAWVVGANVPLTLPEPTENCQTVQGYEYQGRDDEGRPTWEYPEMERCYE